MGGDTVRKGRFGPRERYVWLVRDSTGWGSVSENGVQVVDGSNPSAPTINPSGTANKLQTFLLTVPFRQLRGQERL